MQSLEAAQCGAVGAEDEKALQRVVGDGGGDAHHLLNHRAQAPALGWLLRRGIRGVRSCWPSTRKTRQSSILVPPLILATGQPMNEANAAAD